MRPRSALRRPPSAGPSRPSTALRQLHSSDKNSSASQEDKRRRAGHRFAHALREKISIHRHAMNLDDAPPASFAAVELTGETDAEYFSVLRNREDAARTLVHRLATLDDHLLHEGGSCAENLSESLLPSLALEGASVGDATVVGGIVSITLLTWADLDGVLVTDEPRTLRVFPCAFDINNKAPNTCCLMEAQKFARGSLLLSALGAAGVVNVTHDASGPHGFTLHAVTQSALQELLPAHSRHLLRSALASAEPRQHYCFVVSMDNFNSKALSIRCADHGNVPSYEDSTNSEAHYDQSQRARVDGATQPSYLRVVLEPFTDAELFQWFYLQLVLRAHVDAALDPGLYTTLDPTGNVRSLRGDLISRCRAPMSSLSARHHQRHVEAEQALAFEPPDGNGSRYIVFPPSAPLLSVIGLEGILQGVSKKMGDATVPHGQDLTRLLGCQGIPVVSAFGRYVLSSWAAHVPPLCTPEVAYVALQQLFDLYHPIYGTTRSDLLGYRVAPRVCLSGPRAHRRLKKFPFLAQLVTSEVRRPSVIPDAIRAASSNTDQPTSGEPKPVEDSEVPQSSFSLERARSQQSTVCAPMVVSASHVRVQEECGYLMDRWRSYIGHPLGEERDTRCGDVTVFESHDAQYLAKVQILEVLGRGGSGLVFKAMIDHPVYDVPIVAAVKCFVFPDGMDHAAYVRECLTDVAFFAVFNEVDACGVCPSVRLYDFFVTPQRLQGMEENDWLSCIHNQPKDGTVQLCYLVCELVDKTVGRFLAPGDEDYDVCYDTLLNQPFDDLQVFLLLYSQLILRSEFDGYTVHDLMLHGQLRGDNLGLISIQRLVSKEARRRRKLEIVRASDIVPASSRRFVWFQYNPSCLSHEGTGDSTEEIQQLAYLKFPLADWCDGTEGGATCYLVYVDVGQGLFPRVAELHRRGLIGCPTVDSCLSDDGMGRYWDPNCLYAKGISATNEAGKTALEAASRMRIPDAASARHQLSVVIQHFAEMGYGARPGDEPSDQDVADRLVWTCTRELLDHLHGTYIYSDLK